jgi:type II secretory pathway pseudopilin PulG
MELMVVVIIVAVLAALAMPSMVKARDDRRAYQEAGSLAMLLRSARLRALGRGAAVAVHATASASDRGTFLVYEAVTDDPVASGGGVVATSNTQHYPVSSCLATNWLVDSGTGGAVLARTLIDGLNFNGPFETSANIYTVISVADPKNNTADYWLCFTPTGRVYDSVGAVPAFSTAGVFTSVDMCVGRFDPGVVPTQCTTTTTHPIGPLRHVAVPPTGIARVVSR